MIYSILFICGLVFISTGMFIYANYKRSDKWLVRANTLQGIILFLFSIFEFVYGTFEFGVLVLVISIIYTYSFVIYD